MSVDGKLLVHGTKLNTRCIKLPEWSSDRAYRPHQAVRRNGAVYTAIDLIPKGTAWDPALWNLIMRSLKGESYVPYEEHVVGKTYAAGSIVKTGTMVWFAMGETVNSPPSDSWYPYPNRIGASIIAVYYEDMGLMTGDVVIYNGGLYRYTGPNVDTITGTPNLHNGEWDNVSLSKHVRMVTKFYSDAATQGNTLDWIEDRDNLIGCFVKMVGGGGAGCAVTVSTTAGQRRIANGGGGGCGQFKERYYNRDDTLAMFYNNGVGATVTIGDGAPGSTASTTTASPGGITSIEHSSAALSAAGGSSRPHYSSSVTVARGFSGFNGSMSLRADGWTVGTNGWATQGSVGDEFALCLVPCGGTPPFSGGTLRGRLLGFSMYLGAGDNALDLGAGGNGAAVINATATARSASGGDGRRGYVQATFLYYK